MYVDESVLDDPARLAVADPGDLLRELATGGRQIRETWRLAEEAGAAQLGADGRPRAVLVVGTGAAAGAADVLVAAAGAVSPVPVIGHHDHGLPGWVGVADVVLAVSGSGRSPLTLTAVEDAARRGCRILAVGPPDTPLHYLADRARAPFVKIDGTRPERASLWALATPLLAVGAALGVCRDAAAGVEAAAARLEEIAGRSRPSSESFVNPAKLLALELAGTLPIIWGTSQATSAAASRAATQLAVTAKYPVLHGGLPHPGIYQIAAFDGVFGARAAAADAGNDELDEFFRDRVDDEMTTRLRLILLRDPGHEHPDVTRRAEAVVRVAAERGVGVTELSATGSHPVERMASLVGLLDYASVYLAMLIGIDPSLEPAIHDLDRVR
ncbi:SIS domain-containing protein [Pseudofrankia inefficax]|uniref:Bifunctional glucose-6-phosphate/mannose-6-phosphate isomerase-like protein n=1 Tax=Pseudofrankia inefficax (strain DSM 45817 / CECT 9037 / DDB 130130 / EuI1c) TaxID=298654 RepID=E3J0X9_PSEI1|nr:SIS domain-containing protein [Pseudofrankia inefficax]ADP84043.1 Bifunctional glucose-6-phosphate/mannose-6-phosphate isomerase-like protein [Pseudofrankia inefficax]